MANNGAATAMMACKFDRRLSYSLSIHGSAEFFHVDTWKLREKAENAVFVRCISHFCRSQVMAWTESKTWHHCHVVRCGVNPFDFQPRPDSFTRRLRVLTIGRLHSIKGFDVFLEACHFLAATGIDFDVKMIGEGPLKGNLQKRIVQLCLSSQVRLIGAVSQEDIGRYFDQADVLVVSSFMEGIPVVLMEAMSKELCVIASHVGGVPELVEHGRHGFLVAPGSPEALAQALRAYAEDPSLRRMHGRCGRQRILQAYTTDMMADGMIRLFDTYGQLYKCE
jgi:glycosyltransferase involved in cell wall biosynthesis